MKFLGWPRAITAPVILTCGLVLALSLPLHAQQQGDQPPDADPNRSDYSTQPQAPIQPPAAQSGVPAQPLTLDGRFHAYLHSITSPESVIGPAFVAGIEQGRDSPSAWGQGAEGYGRRFGSAYGQRFISQTIRSGFAAADGEDPRYLPSGKSGVWNRTRYAIVMTFVSRTDSGSRIPAFSRFAGVYSAAFIANTWYPDNQADATHALERGSIALAGSVGWNVFHEFWPDIKKALHHK